MIDKLHVEERPDTDTVSGLWTGAMTRMTGMTNDRNDWNDRITHLESVT